MRVFFFLCLFITVSCAHIGPKVFKYHWKGSKYRRVTTYNYTDGKKTVMSKLIYQDDWLVKETVFTVRWPNGEYHLISEKGFVVFENGGSVFRNDSIRKPDNLIYQHYDTNFVEILEVYKDGKRIPFPYGYEDGYTTMQFLRTPPGVYSWKDGKEYFVRPFTPEEWESHERTNRYLNAQQIRDTTR